MKARPLSRAQLAALRIVDEGQAYYQPYFFRTLGISSRTYDVLRRRRLVEVRRAPENPGSPPMSRRHTVALTAAGRSML